MDNNNKDYFLSDNNSLKSSMKYKINRSVRNIIIKWLINNIMLILIVILLLFGISTDSFYTISNLQNLLISITVIGFLSIGQMYVMSFGEIDLSLGYLMIFSCFFSAKVLEFTGKFTGSKALLSGNIFNGSQLMLPLLIIFFSMFIGLVTGSIVAYLKVRSFIITLGMMSILYGLNWVLPKGKAIFLSNSEIYLSLGSNTVFKTIPIMFIVLLGIVIFMEILFKYNIIGRRITAVGYNKEVASLSGINSNIWIASAFVVSGFFAGLAGIFFTSRATLIDPKGDGTSLVMTAIAIAVLGGTSLEGEKGSPLKVLLGGIFLGMLLNIFILKNFSGWLQSLTVGVLVIFGFLLSRIKKH